MQETTKQVQAVVEHFEKVSQDWGAVYRGEVREISEFDRAARREATLSVLERIHGEAGRTLDLLDVGCGSGDVLSGLDPSRWRVHGVDLVEAMVRQVVRGCPGTRACVGDIIRLPFPLGSFDVVTCLGVLEYVPGWQAALGSLYCVTRPGGDLVISMPNRRSLFRQIGRFEGSVLRGIKALAGRSGGSDSYGRYQRHEWSFAEARRALEDAGFTVREVLLNTYGLKGRLGDHSRLNLAVARGLKGRWTRPTLLSRQLAWTMVLWCRK